MSKPHEGMTYLEKIGVLRIVQTLRTHKTLRRSAKLLGTTHVTLRAFCKKFGIPTPTAAMGRELARTRHREKEERYRRAKIACYLRDHEGEPLPRSVPALAEAAGCTYNAAKKYFYRERQLIKEKLSVLPDLRRLPKGTYFLSKEGKRVLSSAITSYRYRIDKYAMKLDILVKTENGEEKIPTTLKALQTLL